MQKAACLSYNPSQIFEFLSLPSHKWSLFDFTVCLTFCFVLYSFMLCDADRCSDFWTCPKMLTKILIVEEQSSNCIKKDEIWGLKLIFPGGDVNFLLLSLKYDFIFNICSKIFITVFIMNNIIYMYHRAFGKYNKTHINKIHINTLNTHMQWELLVIPQAINRCRIFCYLFMLYTHSY